MIDRDSGAASSIGDALSGRWLKQAVLAVVLVWGLLGCNAADKLDDAIDLVNIDRKPIDTSITGVNAFVNDSRFGSIRQQFAEVRNTLGLRHVRVLLNWSTEVQGAPGLAPDFSFYDSIIDGIPAGVDALVILTGLPSWMSNAANWTDGNPRKTFAQQWVRAATARYGGNGRIVGFQIWNEPNDPANPDNSTLQVVASPANYTELLGFAYSEAKANAPAKLVLNGATTSINQNYPDTVDYNRAMRDAGAQNFIDRWAIHYYGKQFENVVQGGGVADFLNGISEPIWVTESGAQGVNEQLAYVETAWPFLREKIPGIERFYYYQFTEATPPDVTYGLRNLSGDSPVSDLYVYLRDRG